jgi:hypothetical protein
MWFKALHDSVKDGEDFTRYHFAAIVAAAEREACAKVCDDKARRWRENSNVPLLGYVAELEDCAAAIRARGQA